MRLVVQRVLEASVEVEGKVISEIKHGLLVLVGIGKDDTEAAGEWLANKLCGLRIFADDAGKMNLSVKDISGDILLVSQFTLYADCARGRRPGFEAAAKPEEADRIFKKFVEMVKTQGFNPGLGVFGADMKVKLINDGPVTIILER